MKAEYSDTCTSLRYSHTTTSFFLRRQKGGGGGGGGEGDEDASTPSSSPPPCGCSRRCSSSSLSCCLCMTSLLFLLSRCGAMMRCSCCASCCALSFSSLLALRSKPCCMGCDQSRRKRLASPSRRPLQAKSIRHHSSARSFLDGRPTQQHSEAAAHPLHRPSEADVRVLDTVTLVEDQRVPLVLVGGGRRRLVGCEGGGALLRRQHAVGGDEDAPVAQAGLALLLAARGCPAVGEEGDGGAPPLQLLRPVGRQRHRQHQQHTTDQTAMEQTTQQRSHLHRLAQTLRDSTGRTDRRGVSGGERGGEGAGAAAVRCAPSISPYHVISEDAARPPRVKPTQPMRVGRGCDGQRVDGWKEAVVRRSCELTSGRLLAGSRTAARRRRRAVGSPQPSPLRSPVLRSNRRPALPL